MSSARDVSAAAPPERTALIVLSVPELVPR
jgi:hypothetical protein